MTSEIKMPNLSQTTDEVKLLKWLVKKDDEVKKGDILCEVETDKVNMEVESYTDGFVLNTFGEPGQQIKTGSIIAVLGEKGEDTKLESIQGQEDSKKNKKIKTENLKEDHNAPGKSLKKIRATKLVQKLASKHNINLEEIMGTGPRGTIIKKDLEKYLTSRTADPGSSISTSKDTWSLTPNQQAVSANLFKSKTSIPHYYLKTEVLIENLIKSRESSGDDSKLSMYSYFIHCSARVLKKYHKLNGYFKDNKIYRNNQINIGFAVSSDEELYVPVIKDSDKKQISEIDREVKWLAVKAQNKRLEPEDISGGTFTISNLGIYPISEFYGVINYPQAVLLAVGNIRKVVIANDDNSISVKKVVNITGSFDHRIANGAQAAGFLTEIKKLLEEVN